MHFATTAIASAIAPSIVAIDLAKNVCQQEEHMLKKLVRAKYTPEFKHEAVRMAKTRHPQLHEPQGGLLGQCVQ